jgi:hypothetical protein
MALNLKIWESEVQKQLFEAQDFTRFSKNFRTENTKTYGLPQQGTITASVDSGSRPLTAGVRTDTEKEVTLAGLVVDPFYVSITDQHELSYDKRADISSQIVDSIASLAKEKILWGWMNDCPWTSGFYQKTSGASGATLPTGATGTRLKIAYDDIISANLNLDLQNVPSDGRILLIHPSMYKDVKALSQFSASETISTELLARGVVGYIDGLQVVKANYANILVNAVASGTTAPTGVTFGATGTTYSNVSFIYHPNFVGRVIGGTRMFVQQNSPTYTSDVMSATLRVGGALMREDKKGFIPIVSNIG